MSTRHTVDNQQMLLPGSTSRYYGRYFYLDSVGTNQDKTKPLEPHPYSLTVNDRYDPLIKLTKFDGTISYDTMQCVGNRARAWASYDDYKLYAKLEEKYDSGEFNAFVFAGELGKTVDMLADRTKQLAKALLAAKRGRFAQAAHILGVGGHRKVSRSTRIRHRDDAGPQHPQSISGGWLELQYGWKPLIEDVFDLADQIAKADKPRSKRIFAQHWIGVNPSSSSPTLYKVSGGGKYSKSIVAYITEDIPSWPHALGLMDPELVEWELVPFSFVVDWFLPVGSWLQARAFAQRAKGKFVITTRDKYHVRLVGIKPPYENFNGWKRDIQTLGWFKYCQLNRVVQSALPNVPLPTFSALRFTGSALKQYNAMALLTSVFGGKIGWSPTTKRL